MDLNKTTIAIIGLGYVGLPLAVEFGKYHPVVGFDINSKRTIELQGGQDRTRECSPEQLKAARHLSYGNLLRDIASCNVFSRIWHWVHVCPTSKIGKGVSLGQNVYVGNQVNIGDRCKVQNNVSLYENVTLEEGVFCGPSMGFSGLYKFKNKK